MINNTITKLFVILIVIFIIFSNDSSARQYVKINVYDLTDKDVLEIAKEMKRLKLDSFKFVGNQAYTKYLTNYVSFIYQPHTVENLYEKSIILSCNNKQQQKWKCTPKEYLKISLKEKLPKAIVVNDNYNLDINVFIDAVKVANNEKPLFIKYPIVSISSEFMDEFKVTFAKNKTYEGRRRYGLGSHCVMTLVHSTKKGENYFTVDWDEFAKQGCITF